MRDERLRIRCLSANLRIQQEYVSAACMWSTTKLNTWNRYGQEVSSTSGSHFHPPKLFVQAEHYTWNYQGVVTWKYQLNTKCQGYQLFTFTHPNCPCKLHTTAEMTRVWWLGKYQVNTKCHGGWACAPKFGNCIKGWPCNVETIERGPKFLPTFLAECYFQNFTVRKLSVMSGVPYFAVSTSVLPSKDQFVHTRAYSSRKSTADFEASPFAKGQWYGKFMSSNVFCENEST